MITICKKTMKNAKAVEKRMIKIIIARKGLPESHKCPPKIQRVKLWVNTKGTKVKQIPHLKSFLRTNVYKSRLRKRKIKTLTSKRKRIINLQPRKKLM